MEKTSSLHNLDRQLRFYHSKHNYNRQSLSSLPKKRGQVGNFYLQMQQQLYRKRLKLSSDEDPQQQNLKKVLKNPISTALPNRIPQEQHKIVQPSLFIRPSDLPLYTQTITSKQNNQHKLTPEIKKQICQEIDRIQKQNEQDLFKRKYKQEIQKKQKQWQAISSQAMVKEFNQLLMRVKNRSSGVEECQPIDIDYAFRQAITASDQTQYRMLTLFKKLYQQKKTAVNQGFINYIMGFNTQSNQGVKARHRALTGMPKKYKPPHTSNNSVISKGQQIRIRKVSFKQEVENQKIS